MKNKKKNSISSYIPLVGLAIISIAAIYFINNRLTEKDTMNSDSITALSKTDIVVGTGTEAIKGSRVSVLYTGSLLSSGEVFDQKQDKNDPFGFTLGSGQVIAGWDQGLEGMKVGGKRELLIPSSLGYGDNGAGDKIPPKASLKFVVELLSVE